MKTLKKLTSLLLAVVMILTMLSTGMTSLASIVSGKTSITVSVIVPELIYLKPGTGTFQYYISGAAPGNSPSPTAASTGAISFTTSAQATSITLSYSGASSITLDKTSAANTSTLSANISAGSMAAAGQSGLITWTFTYVIDGQTYHTYAYTYVYSPFMNQAGCQGGYKYKTSIGNEPVAVAYAFLTGITGTYGGAYRSKFLGTSGNTMNPILPGWGNSNVPSGDEDGYFNDYLTYFAKDTNGGVSDAGHRTRDDSKSATYGTSAGGGYLTVDTSRYSGAALSAFPNFKAGWMIMYSDDSSVTHAMESFKTTDNAISFAKDVNYTNGTTGEAFYGYVPTGTVPSSATTYTVRADVGFERSQSSHVHLYLQFGLKFNMVNKASLRSALNAAISNNFQDYEYDQSTYSLYQRYIANAATVLGNPDVTTTDINTAIDYLDQATDMLEAADYTATVNHKLPAADGFTYTHEGVTYTAQDGYITITETDGFEGGSDVTVNRINFIGYTYNSSDASQTYPNQGSDFTKDFYYTAVTGTINFNYGAGYDDYVTNNETKSKSVTYGQPYGALPAPKMDGWRFVRWVNGSGTAVDSSTICNMVGGTLDLTAVWACNFGGGHGTQEDPFLIANSAHLDKIDDTTAYCIFDNGSCTAGKYYKQTANITYELSKMPVGTFNGNYDGQNYTITVPTTLTVADTNYGCFFGNVADASVSDINVVLNGTMRATGTGATYAGFFGNVTSSSIRDIQITYNGTLVGATSGILAGAISGTTVSDSAVTLNGGTISGDAFIGSQNGTLANTWVLVNTEPTGFATSSANNIMRIRENGSAVMAYANGQYSFTASPNTGWSVQYRDAEENIITSGAVYSPAASANGEQDYVCFVQTVTFAAGSNGTLDGAGSYVLRQGETVTGLTPNPNSGYAFLGWTNPTNGYFSASAPYTFTMGSTTGTITANFGINSYTLAYDANAGGAQIEVPAPAVYACTSTVIIAPEITRTGYTFKKWNTRADGSGSNYNAGQQYNALSSTNGETVTLYAQWDINSYNVSFNTNCELQINDMIVEYGKPITFPSLYRSGYRSVEWCVDASLTGSGYLPGTTKNIYGRTTFYAKWNPITYTFSFSAPGATNIPANVTRSYDSGSWTLPASYVPVKTGYNFNGWDTAAGGNGTRYYPLDIVPGNLTNVDGTVITLYAQWTEATYNVTWDLQGGTIDGSTVNPTSVATFSRTYILPTGTLAKAGYSFKGWYTEINGGTQVTNATTVSITADTAFYARWAKAGYTVAFSANGGTGTMESVDATCGTPFALPQNAMTRAGYTFANWNTAADGSGVTYGNAATISNDLTDEDGATVTLYAQWTGMQFSVTFNFNGVTGSMIAQSVTMDGAAITLRKSNKTSVTMNNATYNFYGWAYSTEEAAAMQRAYADQASFALTEEVLSHCTVDWTKTKPTITLYAVWARNATVTWDLVGGSLDGSTVNPTSVVVYGDTYVLPVGSPVRNRYTFAGWFTALENGTGTEVTNETVKTTNEDTTIYAHWVQTGNLDSNYITEYYLQNADGSYPTDPTYTSSSSAEIGTTVNAAQNTYVGYTINLEHALNKLSGEVTDATAGETLTLKVYYTINSYTVTFNPNGGSGTMAPQSFKYNTADDLNPCTFTNTGYSFAGWSRTAGGTVAFSDGGSFTIGNADTTLYAVWTAQTYTISFDSGVPSIVAAFGAPIQAPANPEKPGYSFKGWLKNGAAYTIPATMPAESFSLTADWEQDTYYVTYYANGGEGSMEPTSFVYGGQVTLAENAFTKTGYSFLGWSRTATGAVAFVDGTTFTAQPANLDLYAVWSPNIYFITFDSGVARISAYYGSTITAPADPTRTGYKFNGWLKNGEAYTIPQTMPAESIDLIADWQVNSYTVTFVGNGGAGSMDPQSVNYGVRTNLNDNQFTKTGYAFAGWAESAQGSVVYANKAPYTVDQENPDNITLYAIWTVNTYTIEFRGNGATDGSMDSMACSYDNTYALTENAFTKTGANFAGWATTATGTVVYADKGNVSNLTAEANGKVILYAIWENIPYTVSFDGNGATSGTVPASESTVYNAQITLPTTDIAIEIEDDRESRTFIGWMDPAGTQYAAGATYTCPASDVIFTAVWSANYYELNEMIAQIDAYRDAQILPASATNDPMYAAGGDIADAYETDGMYDWDCFDTEALESAYATVNQTSNRNLPQSEQSTVDALTQTLVDALDALTLISVDHDYRYECCDYENGCYDEFTDAFYPACEEDNMHSYNSILALIDAVLNESESTSVYTAESVEELRVQVYGNNADVIGFAHEIEAENLKGPAQEMFGEYVQILANMYHTLLVLKDADYSRVDALITEYLPSLNGVAYSDLSAYYEQQGISDLTNYYANIERGYKKVSQDYVDDVIYNELKDYIDALVPRKADYTSLFNLILSIPKGTEGFSYPASQVNKNNISTWLEWAQDNAGNLSAAIDADYLAPRYTASSVAALNRVLDNIDWDLNIFGQSTINGSGNIGSYAALLTGAVNGLERRTYTMTFMRNDGTSEVFHTIRGNYYGDAVTFPLTEPKRDGYIFRGWSTDTEGATELTTNDLVQSDIVAYAKWSPVTDEDIRLIAREGSTTVIDKDRGYIYGLKISVTVNELNTVFLDVIGNGRLEYVYSGFVGTGTVVNLVSNYTDEVLESYRIVIFGDVNGDGIVNSGDVSLMSSVASRTYAFEAGSAEAFAADIVPDGAVNTSDLTVEKAIAVKSINYDQANRSAR